MFLSRPLTAALVALGLWGSGPAWAFKLNPCARILMLTSQGPLQRTVNPASGCGIVDPQLQLAVHEHMTVAALQAYGAPVEWQVAPTIGSSQEFDYLAAPPWSLPGGREHSTLDLVKGTWWNDDPNMYLWGQRADFVKGLFHLREVFSGNRPTYAGGTANCKVPAGMHLGHQSHYGDLQHLHFMSTLGRQSTSSQRVEQTTSRALTWMSFAYAVATGDLAPHAPLTQADEQRLGLPPIARNLCVKPDNVKVRSLFARAGAGSIAHRDRITPDVALGSMLHLLQDSFSPAHTCRVKAQVGGQSLAVLRDVYNYNEQDVDEHKALDVFPTWFAPIQAKQVHAYANDPVAVGAWLIGAVDRKLPWPQVRDHLMQTAFASATDPQAASAPCVR